ncbi:MAG: amidohydrolase [Bacteroidetes bacterium]|nr:MAG: amidohydrolase [Bacteroidota bacterium]
MNHLKAQIKALAHAFHEEVTGFRRHLHRHPELSFQEVETARFVAQKLTETGITPTTGVAGNGVVALIEGEKSGPAKTVALRADLDALPIVEANEVSYKSENEGVMHACGHDVHTASLLGTAKILYELRPHFSGTVKLIFQPAEERLPGGASLMIKAGVLENPRPESIFGQHVHPPLEAGKVGFRPGMYMASADEIYVRIQGRGGHGALPQNCVDPIAITAQIITALQQIVSRQANPTTPTVLTFGKINSIGGATNIIPNEVRLEGTFRTLNENWRDRALESMKKMAEGIAKSMGGNCIFDIVRGYPFLVNDEALTRRARDRAVAFLGAENVVDLPIRMTAEDFAWYSQKLPACFYRLGTGNPARGITSPVHTNTFDVDEACLETSIGLMSWLTITELENAP